MIKLNRKKKICVPVEIVELEEYSYHILIPVLVDGKYDGFFVVDTGASKTVVDTNFIGDFEIADIESGEMTSGGLGGEIPDLQIAVIESVSFGDFVINKPHVAVIDLDNINAMYQRHCNRKINGLLGSDILVKYKAVIDYDKSVITFSL